MLHKNNDQYFPKVFQFFYIHFFHKTLYVLIKREKQSAVFPFCKPFSSVQGTPFDGFPYGLRAAKHRAALRLSLHSRFKERSPLKIPLRDNYPFLVWCAGCRTDTAGRFCAAPSRGVLCKWDTLYTFLPSTFSYTI